MADLLNNSGIAARTADILLRGTGGRSVLLRMPAAAAANDITEQLGLATPEFQDVELAPVIFRSARAQVVPGKPAQSEMLVSPTAVQSLIGSLGYGAAETMFDVACGVLIDGILMSIESATTMESEGIAYLYLLKLRAPLTQSI